jgi:plastocyanin
VKVSTVWLLATGFLCLIALAACAKGSGGAADGISGSQTCHPAGTSVALVAHNVRFDPTCVAAVADTALRVEFDNEDGGVQHDFAVYSADPAKVSDAQVFFKGRVVQGPAMISYTVRGLPSGTYHFQCTIHPERMFGTYVVD